MRAIIQRVSEARVKVDDKITGQIGIGLLVLLGIEEADTKKDLEWLAQKISKMRIFADEKGLMNKALNDINGQILLISQFTLFAETQRGNRPGFTRAAKSENAIPLYELMVNRLAELSNKKVEVGKFGADMKVSLVNDGPVTIIIDSKEKEKY